MRNSDFLARLGVAVLVTAIFFAGHYTGGLKAARKWRNVSTETKVDTLLIRDSITLYKPEIRLRMRVDTMLVPVTDTLVMHDTLWLSLPRESVHYGDSLFDAWVSGYRPALDSLRLYPTTQIVTRTEVIKTKPRWSAGVQVGVGVYDNQKLSPYVGVGVQYSLFSW